MGSGPKYVDDLLWFTLLEMAIFHQVYYTSYAYMDYMVINGHKNFIGHRWTIIYECSLFFWYNGRYNEGNRNQRYDTLWLSHFKGMAWNEHMDSMRATWIRWINGSKKSDIVGRQYGINNCLVVEPLLWKKWLSNSWGYYLFPRYGKS